jgi:hypothetical protein
MGTGVAVLAGLLVAGGLVDAWLSAVAVVRGSSVAAGRQAANKRVNAIRQVIQRTRLKSVSPEKAGVPQQACP